MSTADRIISLGFFGACREADQLCIDFKVDGEWFIWYFEDLSSLKAHSKSNRMVSVSV